MEHDELRSRIIFGIILIVGGVVLFLNHASIFLVFGLWPLILVGLGINSLLCGSCDGRMRGMWLLAIGLWFSLGEFHIMRYRHSWPLILIAIGALITWEAVAPRGDGTGREVPDGQ